MRTPQLILLTLLFDITANTWAADGTITFKGAITGSTCTITGNGTASKDFTVTLPTVAKGSLAVAGNTAGKTIFTIDLAACTPTTGSVHAYFEAGANVDTTTNRLKLETTGTPATNVEIGLLNGDDTLIKLGLPDATQNSKPASLATGAASLRYSAEYYATGVATAGAANSSVMYTVILP